MHQYHNALKYCNTIQPTLKTCFKEMVWHGQMCIHIAQWYDSTPLSDHQFMDDMQSSCAIRFHSTWTSLSKRD